MWGYERAMSPFTRHYSPSLPTPRSMPRHSGGRAHEGACRADEAGGTSLVVRKSLTIIPVAVFDSLPKGILTDIGPEGCEAGRGGYLRE